MSLIFSGIVNDEQGNLSGYAWGENIGWISFSCDNRDTCADVEYGVSFDTKTGIFRGHAWGENIGWISFPDNPFPTILLPVNEGVNLFYIPSVHKKPYMAPYNNNILNLYYHDHNSSWVDSNCKYMKEDSLHALYASCSGTLFLDIKEISYPILYFQGFLNEAFSPHQNYPPEQCIDPNIFDFMDRFDPNGSSKELLGDLNCLRTISGKNTKTGKWESSYKFFGRPSGTNVDLKSNTSFIIVIK